MGVQPKDPFNEIRQLKTIVADLERRIRGLRIDLNKRTENAVDGYQSVNLNQLEEVSGAIITDHGGLVGLLDDDHTQYALLAGRAGGQTLSGGTAAGEDITIQSTANASKGDINLGTTFRFAEGAGAFFLDNLNMEDLGQVLFYEDQANGTNNVALRAAESMPFSYTIELPADEATGAEQFLATIGSAPVSLEWRDISSIAGSLDHGGLLGLADDDHDVYLPRSGVRPMTGTLDIHSSSTAIRSPANTTFFMHSRENDAGTSIGFQMEVGTELLSNGSLVMNILNGAGYVYRCGYTAAALGEFTHEFRARGAAGGIPMVMDFRSPGATTTKILMGASGTANAAVIDATSSEWTFRTARTLSSWLVDVNGNNKGVQMVSIVTAHNFQPLSDNDIDLGHPSLRWKTGHIGTNLFVNGTIFGGTASGGNLTLGSTSHPSVKGKIFLGASSAYDGQQLRLGIGTTTPEGVFHGVGGTGYFELNTTSSLAGMLVMRNPNTGATPGAHLYGQFVDTGPTIRTAGRIGWIVTSKTASGVNADLVLGVSTTSFGTLEVSRFTSSLQWGLGTTSPGAKAHIEQTGAAAATPVLRLDQDDQDFAFIDFQGYTAANKTLNLSTLSAGTVSGIGGLTSVAAPAAASWTFGGMIKMKERGNDVWVPYYT